MPESFALSESAVAVLRFRIKGWRFPVLERDRDAFSELVEAGIMEPDGKDFRFTEGGWAQRGELLAAAEAHLRSLEPRLPDRLYLLSLLLFSALVLYCRVSAIEEPSHLKVVSRK
jgi:hypothetical protein